VTPPTTHASITGISGSPVRRIRLQVKDAYTFAAGQYLNIVNSDGSLIPMSIASAPERLPELELHYRPITGVPEADILNNLLDGEHLVVTTAEGAVRSGKVDQPLFAIAGGSGAAQAFSCAEHRAAIGANAPTVILWCADEQDDIYEKNTLTELPGTHLHVCIDNQRTPENEGMVWLSKHARQYHDAYVLIAGSPGFVYTVTDLLLAIGFDADQLHADAYAYAPRQASP
jgi:CDP-4-dehydro-6-deoxyglucose reductase